MLARVSGGWSDVAMVGAPRTWGLRDQNGLATSSRWVVQQAAAVQGLRREFCGVYRMALHGVA